MSDTVTGTGTTTTTSVADAIAQMTAAFDQAISTNLQITQVKTEKGSEESAAQQRPNIG